MDFLKRVWARNPAMILTALGVAGVLAYRVFVEKTPAAEVLTEDYVLYLIPVVQGFVTRLGVFAPDTVERIARELDAEVAAYVHDSEH